MKLVGITGSIGCGKTTIAKIINNLGYTVFDVDGWVRRIYFDKVFLQVLDNKFPGVVKNGTADKRALRNIVFSDNNKLKVLEGLIHPFLEENVKKIIRKNAYYDDLFFLDVALLFEMKWDKFCDFILVADVDYEIQKQRVMLRDKVSAEDFDKINNVQMKNSEKIKMADIVIDTNKSRNLLKAELINVIKGLEACHD
ncbi:MAG: dephospho-CoA kinase [Alphaproteobacteria bacterium]|nr:dephospho-CoA kinase [Alphaproteobacteria bacterium]